MQGRILVVDDEKAMLVALKGLLSREGYEVETAQSGAEALRCIDTGSFHLFVEQVDIAHHRFVFEGRVVVVRVLNCN